MCFSREPFAGRQSLLRDVGRYTRDALLVGEGLRSPLVFSLLLFAFGFSHVYLYQEFYGERECFVVPFSLRGGTGASLAFHSLSVLLLFLFAFYLFFLFCLFTLSTILPGLSRLVLGASTVFIAISS